MDTAPIKGNNKTIAKGRKKENTALTWKSYKKKSVKIPFSQQMALN